MLSEAHYLRVRRSCFFPRLTICQLQTPWPFFFIEPLKVTLLSALLLGEAIYWRRLSAISCGFIGAMIIIRPAFDEVGMAALYPVGAATCFSLYIILTRKLANREHPVRMQFATGVSGALFMTVALLFGDGFGIPVLSVVLPTVFQWTLLALLGLIGASCHLLVVFAYQRAPVSVLAPFQYVEIVGATALGWMLFNDFPDTITWLGIAIIIASGVYVFHRESRIPSH